MKISFIEKTLALFLSYIRQAAIVALIISSVVFYAACQPTPDKPPIFNRAQGWLEEYVIDPLPEGKFKKIDAPEHWKSSFVLRDGQIIVNANVDVAVPEIGNTPVLELEQREFTEEHLSELVRYFAKNSKPYQIPPMTKAEIAAELGKIENREGDYASPGTNIVGYQFAARKLMETAPETVQKKDKEPIFAQPEKDEVDIMKNHSLLTQDDEVKSENTYAALVDAGDGLACLMTATKYDMTVGSTSCFTYKRGIVISEEDIKVYKRIYESYFSWIGTKFETMMGGLDVNWLNDYKQFIEKIEERSSNLDVNWVKQQADKVLRDLKITHMSLGKQEKGVSFSDDNYKQFRLNPMGVNFEKAKTGYKFTYYRDAEGLQASYYYKTGGFATPTFCSEIITVFVSEDGIMEFEWENMSIQVGIVAENTKLVPFNTVVESLKDYLIFSAHPDAKHRYEITGMSLIAGNITAYNKPDNAWQLPVWLVEYDYYGEIEPGVEIKTPGGSWIFFSAIDGVYIPLLSTM